MDKKEQLQKIISEKDPVVRLNRALADKKVAEAVLKLEMVKGEKGEEGKPGYTPVKGKDYFTPQEINNVAHIAQSLVKPGPQGTEGEKGKDGKDGYTPLKGLDYWTPSDRLSIMSDVLERIPKAKDGISPNVNELVSLVSSEMQKKPIHLTDVKGTERLVEFLKLGGFRGGGGLTNITGLVTAGTNVTITGNGTTSSPYNISSTGGGGTVGPGTINQIAYFDSANTVTSLTTATYPSLTELSYVKGVTSDIQTQLGTKAPTTSPTFATSITGSYLTASQILGTDGSKNIVSLPVATYPSLTELAFVKGVTSAVQTQINTKAPTASPTFTGTVSVPATNFTVGASIPFSDSAGTLTLQNIDAIDATTESTIEAAIDTLANLTSIQGQTVTLTGAFIRSGAHSLTLTTTNTTSLTLPTTGTLATLAGTETLSGKTLTSPKFTDLDYIADANGNELIVMDTVTSAVPYIRVANNTTTNNPSINADGETNVGLTIQGKGTKGVTIGNALIETVFALTDGATPALDASLGNIFTLSAAGNRTIAVPTNATNGQKIVIRHLASAGARILSLNTGAGGFRFGSDITGLSQTESGKYDYIGCIYNSTAGFWDVVSYSKGY